MVTMVTDRAMRRSRLNDNRAVDRPRQYPIRVIGRPVRDIAVWVGLPVIAAALVRSWMEYLGRVGTVDGWPLRIAGAALEPVPEAIRSTGPVLLAALVGAGAALWAQWGERNLHLDPGGLMERSFPGRWDRIAVEHVAAVFIDGSDLVVVDVAGDQWCRMRCDRDAEWLREVFVRQGYPWCRDDPHSAAYRLWVSGGSGVPRAVDRLLRRRAAATRDWTDVRLRSLTRDLRACGIVVRDRGRRQYWRRLSDGPDGE